MVPAQGRPRPCSGHRATASRSTPDRRGLQLAREGGQQHRRLARRVLAARRLRRLEQQTAMPGPDSARTAAAQSRSCSSGATCTAQSPRSSSRAELHFFFAADREWCQANVLPLLLGTSLNEPAGRGMASCPGGSTDQLLDAGLLHVITSTPRLTSNSSRTRCAGSWRSIWQRSRSLAKSTPRRGSRCSQGSRRLTSGSMGQPGWMDTRPADPEVSAQQWRRWMRAYLGTAGRQLPVRLTFEEASALAGWVDYLGDAIAEAVDLAVAVPAGLAPHGRLLHRMRASRP